VRTEVIRALFKGNPPTANRLLLRELQDSDPKVRLCAYELAELSHDPAVFGLLHRQLEVDIDSDEQAQVAAETVALLARLGRTETLPIFRRLLMSRRQLFRSRNLKALQQQIVESLSSFASPAAEKLLEELAKGPHKQAARKALKERQEQQ
jgi:HEAT repeat protein